ncbi:MAG: lysylphosphatidylglycerol synthase transmembrane domain-containing protein [Ferruginibacter sp.]
MQKRLLSILQYLIFLGAGIFLVWWQLKGMTNIEKQEFANAFRYANYWLLIPIIIMALLSHLSRAIRWKYLMEPLDYDPKLKNVFAVVMVGYLANSAIPRLGEILKCTFLARYEKLNVGKLVGTIIIERTFDFICFISLIAITILIQIDVVGDYIQKEIIAFGKTAGLPIWLNGLIVLSIITLSVIIIKILFRKHPHNKIIYKTNLFLKGITAGFKTIKQLKKKRLFLLHTIFIWTLYLLQVYVGFQAMEGTSHLSIKAACSVLTLASLAMIVTPGGIGSFPLFVMKTLFIYNIASPLGKAFGWMIWGVSTGIIIITGLVCLLILPYINRKKDEISQQHT